MSRSVPVLDPDTAPWRRCIFYYRERPEEPDANTAALEQQTSIRDRFIAFGATIVAEFTEVETTAAASHRLALGLAYEAALLASADGKSVELVILRVDPIGSGPRFSMTDAERARLKADPARISINYQGCEALERQLRHEWLVATGGDEVGSQEA